MLDLFVLGNFAILCIAFVMAIIAIQDFHNRRFSSIAIFAILGMVIALSGTTMLEYYSKLDPSNRFLPVLATFLGYAIRPFLLYAFILLAKKKIEPIDRIITIPIFINVILYASALFIDVPFLRGLTFYYTLNGEGSAWVYNRGALNYFAHVLCFLYLVYLLYISVRNLRGKHRSDAYSILICAILIIGAVIIEMIGVSTGVLNVTIATSSVFYYLFLLKEENRRDALTGLFDRKTFYSDAERFDKAITGIIEIDMNGLKAINDAKGHKAGDEALIAIAQAIALQCSRDMYLYRIGGDEFVVLALGGEKESLISSMEKMRASIAEKGYSCSLGCCDRDAAHPSVRAMLQSADEAMYGDKSAFYRSHPECNRRSH